MLMTAPSRKERPIVDGVSCEEKEHLLCRNSKRRQASTWVRQEADSPASVALFFVCTHTLSCVGGDVDDGTTIICRQFFSPAPTAYFLNGAPKVAGTAKKTRSNNTFYLI